METNNTYYPEDIEQLLLAKSFKELLPDEKTFVLQHVESKEEYQLMRQTLLAIKKEVDKNQSIKPKPQTKQDLLALLEQKKRRAGWFRLNGLWAALFPPDVTFFKQPGFQFASIAVLIGLSFFITQTFIGGEQKKNLAIQTIPKQTQNTEKQNQDHKQSNIAQEESIAPTPERKEDNQESLTQPKKESKQLKSVKQDDLVVKGNIGEKDERGDIKAEGLAFNRAASKKEKSFNQPSLTHDEVMEETEEIVYSMDSISPSRTTTTGAVTLLKDVASKTKNNASRSLSDDEDLIDLLHITL